MWYVFYFLFLINWGNKVLFLSCGYEGFHVLERQRRLIFHLCWEKVAGADHRWHLMQMRHHLKSVRHKSCLGKTTVVSGSLTPTSSILRPLEKACEQTACGR